MAKILIVHADKTTRHVLEAFASLHHQVTLVEDLRHAARHLGRHPPDVILAGLDVRKKEAIQLLYYLRREDLSIPTVVIAGPGAGIHQVLAMKIGAAAFLEYPIERDILNQAISQSLQASKEAKGEVPPITEEESNSNLTELERKLNRHMQCFAGKNQVYLQSLIVGRNHTTKPRVALKCPLRKQFGLPPTIYYEYIRDVCCGNPAGCPAFQEFRARNSA